MKAMKKNCWQFKGCGRQPGGPRVDELGVCPASTDESSNGRNGGINAGRYCWRVAGTLCDGEIQGTWARRILNCSECDFLMHVKEEEGDSFVY
jgi:hypothetical protein